MKIPGAPSAYRSSDRPADEARESAMTIDPGTGPGLERIDAVYLWVDGGDPRFQRELALQVARHSGSLPGEAVDGRRFRDNDELRYSLRSLEAHAAWIGDIHIVTNGQAPEWLNTRHERIHLVTHDTIFPDPAGLPTFNSCAIELNLHRIPGLSRRFIYLNDDLYLGRETRRDDFLPADGSHRLYVEPTFIHRRFAHGPIHDRAYLHTARVLDRLWGRKRRPASAAYFHTWKDRWLRRRPRRRLPAHTPQLYDRAILADLERLLPDEFKATRSHRFRAPGDLVLRLIYFYSLLESGRYPGTVSVVGLDWESEDYFFLMLGGSLGRVSDKLARMERLRPKFFCLNDDLEAANTGHPACRRQRDFFQGLFPSPAPFESMAGGS
jgi:hypothetical protein